MSIETATTFHLDDLAVFDEAHLREMIGDVSGVVSPSIAGKAFACDEPDGQPQYADLVARIEHALPPDDRAAFARARQQSYSDNERAEARETLLKRLFWELTYWKTPDDYDRLTAGEQVHLGALDIAHVDGAVVLDAGAGAGRVTLPLARRARLVYALDAAPPLLHLLERKLAAAHLRNVELLRGLFRRIPLPDDSVDAAIACSAFGPQEAHGGQRGLDELQRVTRPGGRIVILWPEYPAWFMERGFHYVTLPGHLTITFPTLDDALDMAARYYGPVAVRHLESTRRPELPFWALGVKPPREICWLTVRK
ncbi:MAG TPA: methyltransferase domain-containing protein [Ktedonobacterales bacterium]|nr:methyltransferase domain-containing protein [Ktedonobacterales bacterium]